VKLVIINNGTLSVDEVIACSLLKFYYNVDEIIRTEDKNVISDIINKDKCLILDVNGEFYNFNLNYNEDCIVKISSIYSLTGLIWNSYGRLIITKIIPKIKERRFGIIYRSFYYNVVELLDDSKNVNFNMMVRNLTDSKDDELLLKANKFFMNGDLVNVVDTCKVIIENFVKNKYNLLKVA
jgi:uncharacterized UPF0160 family protein